MIEKDTVQKYTENKIILLYKRFIDDIFIITQRHSKSITTLKNELNISTKISNLLGLNQQIKWTF